MSAHVLLNLLTPPPQGLTLSKNLHYCSFLLNLRSKVYQTARPYNYVE